MNGCRKTSNVAAAVSLLVALTAATPGCTATKGEGTPSEQLETIVLAPVNEGFRVVHGKRGDALFDDFSAYEYGRYAPFGPWRIFLGRPATVEEALQPDGTIGKALEIGGDGSTLLTEKGWKDLTLELNARNRVVGRCRIFFRVKGACEAGYFVERGYRRTSTLRLVRFREGRKHVLAAASSTCSEEDGWIYYRIAAIGKRIAVYFNGKKVIDVRDDTPGAVDAPGRVGVGTEEGRMYYDNIRVMEVKP